tara:strand:- start:194 stop:403 length:210 start_codon:yes stop_codon:yes gene_type:complete
MNNYIKGNTYIFKYNHNKPIKGKVIDLTETTIQIEWESNNKVRYTLSEFQYYQILENLGGNGSKQLLFG